MFSVLLDTKATPPPKRMVNVEMRRTREKNGDEENRTPDLVYAKHALYQLSYTPTKQPLCVTLQNRKAKLSEITSFVLFQHNCSFYRYS